MENQELINYIKAAYANGHSKEDVYLALLNQGWKVNDIEMGFQGIQTKALDKEEKAETHERTIKIIVTIGAALIGAGIFSFIASNWQETTKTVKIIIILFTIIVFNGGGWYLREKMNYSKIGGAFILLGSISYGAGIFLTGQMYHMSTSWPNGFLLWMLGVIAMAQALNFFPLFYLAIPLGIIAFIGQPWEIFERDLPGFSVLLFTSTFLLIITTVVTFAVGINTRKRMPEEYKDYY